MRLGTTTNMLYVIRASFEKTNIHALCKRGFLQGEYLRMNRKLTILLCFSLVLSVSANVETLVRADAAPGWIKTFGGTDRELARCVIQTSDGGFLMAGYTRSFGAGLNDVWLVKTDVNGNMQWNKTYGGTEDDEAYWAIQTTDGGYAMACWSYSLGGRVWLVKTDTNGNAQWNKTYGNSQEQIPHAIVQTSDGGYAIACYLRQGTQSYFWLIKTNSNGDVLWDKTYGVTNKDQALCLVRTSDGDYALGGVANHPIVVGQSSFELVKTDANGNLQWNKTYGGTGSYIAYSVIQTSDGGYALAGKADPKALTGTGQASFWLVKTNSSGNMEWNMTYGGVVYEVAYSFCNTSDNGYAIAGYQSFSGGGYGPWLIKTDSMGNA